MDALHQKTVDEDEYYESGEEDEEDDEDDDEEEEELETAALSLIMYRSPSSMSLS